jgi:hypothetical protein
VNLGDDTDTTAAIYGQLAGAYYGYKNLPKKWVEQVYAKRFIEQLSKWIVYEGTNWKKRKVRLSSNQPSVGMLRSTSAENLPSNKSEASCAEYPSKRHYKTAPTGKKLVRNTIVPSNMDPNSAETSTLTTTVIDHSITSSKIECKAVGNVLIESKGKNRKFEYLVLKMSSVKRNRLHKIFSTIWKVLHANIEILYGHHRLNVEIS